MADARGCSPCCATIFLSITIWYLVYYTLVYFIVDGTNETEITDCSEKLERNNLKDHCDYTSVNLTSVIEIIDEC